MNKAAIQALYLHDLKMADKACLEAIKAAEKLRDERIEYFSKPVWQRRVKEQDNGLG